MSTQEPPYESDEDEKPVFETEGKPEKKHIDAILRKILCDNLGCRDVELKETSDLITDLGADDMDLTDISSDIEDAFDFSFTEDELDAHTYQDLKQIILNSYDD